MKTCRVLCSCVMVSLVRVSPFKSTIAVGVTHKAVRGKPCRYKVSGSYLSVGVSGKRWMKAHQERKWPKRITIRDGMNGSPYVES